MTFKLRDLVDKLPNLSASALIDLSLALAAYPDMPLVTFVLTHHDLLTVRHAVKLAISPAAWANFKETERMLVIHLHTRNDSWWETLRNMLRPVIETYERSEGTESDGSAFDTFYADAYRNYHAGIAASQTQYETELRAALLLVLPAEIKSVGGSE